MADSHKNGPIQGPLPTRGINCNAVNTTPLDGVLFDTASRTHNGGLASDGVYATDAIYNPNAKGVRLYVIVANGSGTVTVKIQVQNHITGAWIDLAGAASAALNNSSAILTVYPGLTGIADSAGVTSNQHLGSMWRAVATVATAAETFSVSADYLL
jgi:hypothetical protein